MTSLEVCTLSENRRASRHWSRRAPVCCALAVLLVCPGILRAAPLQLTAADAARIGRKVWQNECAGTVAGLTSWNAGENFASLGIGHFIWYPSGVRGPFEESFPAFLRFAAERDVNLPEVARAHLTGGCPWSTRSEFNGASQTPAMQELRRFLAGSINLQAEFLVQRLQQALPKMLLAAAGPERANVQPQFDRVASTAAGCYALVDYVNFKGEGVLETERYRSQGWGMLQVLGGMKGRGNGRDAAAEFAGSAARILTQRVENSPPERGEKRWLPGWLSRVKTYTRL